MIVGRVLTILSAIALAAHFLRWGSLWFMAASLLVPLFLIPRKPWGHAAAAVLLGAGTLVWIVAATQLIERRIAAGDSWARAAAIMAAVAATTGIAAAVNAAAALKRKEPSKPPALRS